MYRNQLISILKNDPFTKDVFQDVYPIDLLPEKVERFPAAIIANTDESNEDGEHWVTFYFPNRYIGEFFDSYGNAAYDLDYRFYNFMNTICRKRSKFYYNTKILQGPSSKVCGHYCLYYILNRSRGLTANSIIEQFGMDNVYNDFIVKDIIDQYLSV